MILLKDFIEKINKLVKENPEALDMKVWFNSGEYSVSDIEVVEWSHDGEKAVDIY